MQDQPTRIELLQAVAAFLRDKALPNLTGQPAFHARVAANVVDIVVRELQLLPAAEAGELKRLHALLNEEGELDELNARLCDRIASGEMTLATPGLKEHLWELTLNKLAIDQPGYATYRQILETRRSGESPDAKS